MRFTSSPPPPCPPPLPGPVPGCPGVDKAVLGVAGRRLLAEVASLLSLRLLILVLALAEEGLQAALGRWSPRQPGPHLPLLPLPQGREEELPLSARQPRPQGAPQLDSVWILSHNLAVVGISTTPAGNMVESRFLKTGMIDYDNFFGILLS